MQIHVQKYTPQTMELKYNVDTSFVMKTKISGRNSTMGILYGSLAIVAMAAVAPYVAAYGINYAYAQQSNPCVNNPNPCTYGIKYTSSDNPYGPSQSIAWGIGLGVAGLLAGVGVSTTMRRSR
ncbi:MAG: hypothetical protein KGL95_15575 [Patescibacteria group bacterium]|nr:hypothetical protein [Patescibacteria group bacterium]